MSNHSRRCRYVGFTAIAVASGVIGLAFVGSDQAAAGPLDPPEFDGQAVPKGEDSWERGEVTRLSIPLTPEQMGVVDGGGPPPVPAAEPTYIFVNMDGANLVCQGGDNATSNSSVIACQYGFSGQYPSYGGTAAQRQSVMDAVRADWAPFNMAITDTRPADGAYTMCMTGPANHPFGNGVLGIAPLDCNNNAGSNVVFAFHSASQLGGGFGANTQATTISQEVAHAYGLEHVGSSSDIMNPYNQGGNPSFTDVCIGIVEGQNGMVCDFQHQQHCPGGQQNSYQELLGMFGAADPDDQPPNVAVTYPNQGDAFTPGAQFQIACEASDNQNVASVELWINGDQMGGTKIAPPFEWEVDGIPAGEYEIYCIASDDWDNIAMSSVVSISVADGRDSEGDSGDSGDDSGDESGDESGGDSGGDSGGESGGDSGGGDTGGDSGDDFGDDSAGGGLPPGFGIDRTDSGCACTSDGPQQPAWILLMLLGAPLIRRRRD